MVKNITSNYLLLAFSSMLLLGLSDFLVKKSSLAGLNSIVMMFYTLCGGALVFGLYAYSQNYSFEFSKEMAQYSFANILLINIGLILLINALKTGDASIVIPIGRMGFLVTTICAFLFFNEKITMLKLIGITFSCIGIILLSLK